MGEVYFMGIRSPVEMLRWGSEFDVKIYLLNAVSYGHSFLFGAPMGEDRIEKYCLVSNTANQELK